MSVQKRHTLIRATCSRMRKTVSRGSCNFLSSVETFPKNVPKALGMRAAYTFTGVSTLPNCRRDMAYTRFLISPLGFSIGGRHGSFMTLVSGRDELPLIHLCSQPPLLWFPRTSGCRL